jgi:hypothetical protein
VVYVLSFVHYTASLWYSRAPMRDAALARPAAFAALVAFGASLYLLKFPLILYFGIHFALNEAYLGPGGARAARGPAAALVFAAYLFTLRNESVFAALPPVLPAAALAAAAAYYAAAFVRGRRALAAGEALDAAVLFAGALGVSALSTIFNVRFLHVILYHFVFWTLFPAYRFAERPARLASYAALVSALFAAFWAVSPIGFLPEPAASSDFLAHFRFWSYAHITLSFAASDAHPERLVELFRPRGAGASR